MNSQSTKSRNTLHFDTLTRNSTGDVPFMVPADLALEKQPPWNMLAGKQNAFTQDKVILVTPSLQTSSLEARLKDIEQKMNELSEMMRPKLAKSRISTKKKRAAKAKIVRLFGEGKTLGYSAILKRTGIDLGLIVDICAELEEEGEILPVER